MRGRGYLAEVPRFAKRGLRLSAIGLKLSALLRGSAWSWSLKVMRRTSRVC